MGVHSLQKMAVKSAPAAIKPTKKHKGGEKKKKKKKKRFLVYLTLTLTEMRS